MKINFYQKVFFFHFLFISLTCSYKLNKPTSSVENKRYHINPIQIQHCVENENGCASCNKTTNICFSCQNGYGYNSELQSCTKCARGYYSLGHQFDCQSCQQFGHCLSMSESERNIHCPYYSTEPGSEKCDYCPMGKFVSIDADECFDCPEHCLECENGIHGGKCIQCEPFYGFEEKTSLCVKCSEYDYLHNGSSSDGRHSCSNGYKELENKHVFTYLKNGENEETTEGYYWMPEFDDITITEEPQCLEKYQIKRNKKCYNCTELNNVCLECITLNPETTNDHFGCTKCDPPYVVIENRCSPCPQYTHYVENEQGKGECKQNKIGCIYQINDICYGCDGGYLLRDHECVLSIGCNLTNEATCEICGSGIALSTEGFCTISENCDYTKDYECLRCDDLYSVDDKGDCQDFTNCVKSEGNYCLRTTDNYRVNQTGGNVINCNNNQLICITPNATDIPENQTLDEIDIKCIEKWYLPKNGLTCKTSTNCTKTNISDCVECQGGYYMINGDCLPVDIKDCKTQVVGYCNEHKSDCDALRKENPILPFCIVCDENSGKIMYNGRCLTTDEIIELMGCQSYQNGKCQCAENQALDI